MLPLLIVWRTWILLLFILGIPHMLMLTMACSADVFGDTQRLLMFLNRWCLDMQACWAVAYLTLDVFHMRCFFHRDKTAWFAIASCVTGQALRVVSFTPHLEDTKISGVLPLGIGLHMLGVTLRTLSHPHIVWLFLLLFGYGACNVRLRNYINDWNSNN